SNGVSGSEAEPSPSTGRWWRLRRLGAKAARDEGAIRGRNRAPGLLRRQAGLRESRAILGSRRSHPPRRLPQPAARRQGGAAVRRGAGSRRGDVSQRPAPRVDASLDGAPSPRDDRIPSAHQRGDGATVPHGGLAELRQEGQRAKAGEDHPRNAEEGHDVGMELAASVRAPALPGSPPRPTVVARDLPTGLVNPRPCLEYAAHSPPGILIPGSGPRGSCNL